MKITKLVLVGVFLIGFLFSGFDFGHCEEEFPEWVPEGAMEAAKKFLTDDEEHSAQFLRIEIANLPKCEIRHPYELVYIKYLDYEVGADIGNLFKREARFGFGVYLNDKWIGEIDGDVENGRLKLNGRAQIGFKEDYLGEIYNKYQTSDSIKIYRTYSCRRYFVEKNGKIIRIINIEPYKGTSYFEPETFMLEKKQAIIRGKESLEKDSKERLNIVK